MITSEPVKGSLSRTQSVQAISSAEMPARGDCLKRVSSEPLLSVQEKGVLLKRKLSLLDQDVVVNEDGRSKLKKQGGTRSLNSHLRYSGSEGPEAVFLKKQPNLFVLIENPSGVCMFSLADGDIPEELIDVSDFECSLCMR